MAGFLWVSSDAKAARFGLAVCSRDKETFGSARECLPSSNGINLKEQFLEDLFELNPDIIK